MKHVKWIALVVLIVVMVAGAVGYWQYGQGKQAGITEGLATRDRFFMDRLAGAAAAAQGSGAAASAGQTGGAAAGAAALAGGARSGQGAVVGNFATGQVKSINGNDLEISTATEVTKVKLTDKTQIQKTVSGAPSDIKTGERVVVQGSKGADGTLEATSIQLGAGRVGGPGGGPGQGSQ
ncbi:MAG: DUF5666 domain-containing protein [Anaerolineae bacterium]|jgi:hypothetical protein|nr:DUF5666 domain-containing protein [Anaerolineae bacterium]